MSQLTFKEFMKLPREEQNIRYCEMSDHDRFLARLNEPMFDGSDEMPEYTPEEVAAMPPILQSIYNDMKNEKF